MKKYVFNILAVLLLLAFPVITADSGELSNQRQLEIIELIEEHRKAEEAHREILRQANKYATYSLNLNKLDSLGVNYNHYRSVLGYRESSGDYKALNRYGYMGKYQFGKRTLLGLKRESLISYKIEEINTNNFLSNIAFQEAALSSLTTHNYDLLKRYMWYDGKTIDGVKITKEGILAAAHLRGPNSVKRFLTSNGRINRTDANGTSVKDYIKLFS